MHGRIGLLITVAFLAVSASPAWASDATTAWMGNPRHDGELTDSALRPPLGVRWDLRVGKVTSNVLVADGRVIFARQGLLTALDAATGAPLWSVATVTGRIAYDGGRVYATQG